MTGNEVLIIGGDKRQVFLAEYLQKKGYKITCYGNEELGKKKWVKTAKILEQSMCDNYVIVLPMPVSRDDLQVNCQNSTLEIEVFAKLITGNHIIFGGNIPNVILKACEKNKVRCIDYMKLNEIAISNAVATAEGAVCEAIMASPRNLHGSQCLVIGYGRCGEILADKLKGLKACVTVMARRKEVRKKAEAYGHEACDMYQTNLKKYDFIFNTVPSKMLSHGEINQLCNGVVIIDIASNPGGVDFEYCKERRIFAKLCPSLPGRYAPEISGVILAESIDYCLRH